MSKGKAKVNYLGRSGVVMPQTTPSWSFIYEVSTVKHPKYVIGDRVVLPDGREYRYAKSSGICKSGVGVKFQYTGYTSFGYPTVAYAVGDTELTIAAATHATLTKDELRGGYVLIFGNDSIGSYKDVQFRGIIGNDAAGSGLAFKIYLDGPLTQALVAAVTATEVYRNPYASLKWAINQNYPVAGVPATYVSATNMYFWVQVKGTCWVVPQSSVTTQSAKGCFFNNEGSLADADDTLAAITVPATHTSQYAGHLIAGDYSGNGPLFNLRG